MKVFHRIATAGVMMALAAPVFAAECGVEIDVHDALEFSAANVDVPSSCETFTVTLKHTGKLPKAAMGHNWVLSKAADMQAIANDGIAAGLDNNYLKLDDARVIAHTKIIGGGETDSVSFAPGKLTAGEAYEFFCSFPGHSAVMKGTVTLTP